VESPGLGHSTTRLRACQTTVMRPKNPFLLVAQKFNTFNTFNTFKPLFGYALFCRLLAAVSQLEGNYGHVYDVDDPGLSR
jgi:hypothetical protein